MGDKYRLPSASRKTLVATVGRGFSWTAGCGMRRGRVDKKLVHCYKSMKNARKNVTFIIEENNRGGGKKSKKSECAEKSKKHKAPKNTL